MCALWERDEGMTLRLGTKNTFAIFFCDWIKYGFSNICGYDLRWSDEKWYYKLIKLQVFIRHLNINLDKLLCKSGEYVVS